jgi:hypothetical protein
MIKKLLLVFALLFVYTVSNAEDYKLRVNGVLRLSDGAYIPRSDSNNDWIVYQDWLKAGNIPHADDTPAGIKALFETFQGAE